MNLPLWYSNLVLPLLFEVRGRISIFFLFAVIKTPTEVSSADLVPGFPKGRLGSRILLEQVRVDILKLNKWTLQGGGL